MNLYTKKEKKRTIVDSSYTCNFCDRVFDLEDQVKYHIISKHTFSRTYQPKNIFADLDRFFYETPWLYFFETKKHWDIFHSPFSYEKGNWEGPGWYVELPGNIDDEKADEDQIMYPLEKGIEKIKRKVLNSLDEMKKIPEV